MPKNPPHDKKKSREKQPARAYVRTRRNVKSAPRSINNIMAGKAWMQNLKSAQSMQQDWLAWLQAALPEELRSCLRGVIPRGTELVVLTDSAAWSARVRYALGALEGEMRARAGGVVTRVTVRVAPA